MFARYQLNARPYLQLPTSLSAVHTNTDLIFVYDDFLPEKVIASVQNYDFETIPWTNRDQASTAGGTQRYDFREKLPLHPPFTRITKQYVLHGLRNCFGPDVAIDGLAVDFILRSNRLTASGQKPHHDCQELGPLWTILIHVSGSDGDTVFMERLGSTKEVARVNFRPGRVVVFPSIYPHYGERSSSGYRYILNSVVKLSNFEPSLRILDKSPSLLGYKDKLK